MSNVQQGPVPYVPPYDVSGQLVADGYSQPSTDEIHVYVMSEVNVQIPEPQPSIGDDANDGLSKSAPLRTMDGVRKMIGRRGVAGARIVVHLAGGGYPSVADPWDGQPTSVRYYLTRDLFVGGAEAFVNSWQVRGPRNMVVRASQPTVIGFAPDGLRTKWETTGTGAAPGFLKGVFLRVLRGSREVAFPAQITDNDGTYFWTDDGPNTPGSVYELTDTYLLVDPAAEVVSTNPLPGDVGAADGLALHGAGAPMIYGRVTNGINPAPTFERLAFENLRSNDVPGLSFHTCRFYGSSSIEFRGGWCEWKGCIALCQAGVNILCGTRDVGSNSEGNEYNGRALVVDTVNPPGTSPTADPIWPARGGIGLFVTAGPGGGGAGLRIGSTKAPGVFRVWHSLTVEGQLLVRGPGSALYQAPNLSILRIANPGGVGLRAIDGAMAMIDDANGLVTISAASATDALKVGVGAPIGLGTGAGRFREVGGWAGNFDRRLEVNAGGKPTGDCSRICDSSVWWVD